MSAPQIQRDANDILGLMDMKKVTAVLLFSAISSSAFADVSDIKASNNQFGIQFRSTNVNYTETGNGQLGTSTGTLDTESGRVPGYALSISAMQNLWLGNDYVAAEYGRASGQTNYVGSLQGGVFGSVLSTSTAEIIDYSIRYGKGFIAGNKLMLTPYLEFGSHEWDRGVNFGETYNHDYYGIGALCQFSPVSKLVLSANALLGSTFKSNIDVIGAFSGSLGNSSLYKAGISADYAFTKDFHGSVGIDYVRFKYSISGTYPVGGGYVAWEPDSQTTYTIARIGLGLGF